MEVPGEVAVEGAKRHLLPLLPPNSDPQHGASCGLQFYIPRAWFSTPGFYVPRSHKGLLGTL